MMNLDSQHVVCDEHMNCLLDNDLIRDVVTTDDIMRDAVVKDDLHYEDNSVAMRTEDDDDLFTLMGKSHSTHHGPAHVFRGGHEVGSHTDDEPTEHDDSAEHHSSAVHHDAIVEHHAAVVKHHKSKSVKKHHKKDTSVI
jgi:hypothetical protein